ncbi:armadillo-type protein [Mycena filopes]|nr:armadillo-type protein [Mycena filopes]
MTSSQHGISSGLSGSESGQPSHGNDKTNIPAVLPSALATARIIDDLSRIPYPENIQSPKVELNVNAKDGKFSYDRDFLLQFMPICKVKPDMLPPLDAIGIGPVDQNSITQTTLRGRTPSISNAPGANNAPGFPGSITKAPFRSMGQFGSGHKLSSEERYNNSLRAASGSAIPPFGRPAPMTLTSSVSSGLSGSESGQPSHGNGFSDHNPSFPPGFKDPPPLQASANRWDRKTVGAVDPDSPEIVDRKVKGLLNKLTMEKFDSISDQIIEWANRSEKEKDGRTLIQVIRLVFETAATVEATWCEMYAHLCRKMMEQISPKVQDDGIKNNEGKPIAGGQLFRKYLLNRCQEDFERGWVAKEATAAAAATKAMDMEDKAADEIVLYSDESYAAQKAKRQGVGLIKFIGELFKVQMLTERIMHECVKKLFGDAEDREEEIESLCTLMSTVGLLLDTPKARAHMDVYFSRMKELRKSCNVNPRMQFMLQDVIELRDRKWFSTTLVAAPSTIAAVHEAAAKEKAVQEKESYNRMIRMSRGGSRRGADQGEFQGPGPDGWNVAGGNTPRPPPKAGDLSNFGKIGSSSKGLPMTFGPSSVFSGKKDNKRDSLSRASSSLTMFSMLSESGETSADASKGFAPEAPAQRRRLILQPQPKPTEEQSSATRPLQVIANRWDRKVDPDSPEIVDRKVKGLLNKLTMENFESISDEIIEWANRSEKEKDGRTLIQVIRLVLEEAATDEATRSEMYARLCRKTMEQISPKVQDDAIKNSEGKPIAGGQLFRKYLLNRCQEDFERGWVAKEATAAAAATKAMDMEDKAADEIVLYSDESYAAQKAKRQGLGLIKFIGELFKVQMLTERIMHECVKKLFGDAEDREEEIESLCTLMSTVGLLLDTPKARAHMDVYFSRMKELRKSCNVNPRMQFMLQDLIELRDRKWVSRNPGAALSTIAAVHKAKASYIRMIMLRDGARRDADPGEYQGPGSDGWNVAGGNSSRPPQAGDLYNFGRIGSSSKGLE